MPRITTADGSTTTLGDNYDIDKIGIEFEYPVAEDPDNYPATYGGSSGGFRRTVGTGRLNGLSGSMTREHTGTEVISDILPLHTDEPIDWYNSVIELGEDNGYPFAGCGVGATNFGLHLHLSNVPQAKAEAIDQMCYQPWAGVFFCSSVRPEEVDPWRHGGVNFRNPDFDRNRNGQTYGSMMTIGFPREQGHYEWRFPEPMKPEHLELVLEFLRTIEVGGAEAAREFALRHVEQRNEALTPIDQYQKIRERRGGDWPREEYIGCRYDNCDYDECNERAEYLARLMGDIE